MNERENLVNLVEGRLVGVLQSKSQLGITCILEDNDRHAVMCHNSSDSKVDLDNLIGRWVTLKGSIFFRDDGRILRVDDAHVTNPGLT